MKRRSGLTLIEVLTAIFITGIGLLALLTLIPLGAMNMAQSGQDDRVGYIKENALAISRSAPATPTLSGFENDTVVTSAMTNPGGGLAPIPTSNYSGPSYPVFIDPLGQYYNTNVLWRDWVAGFPNGMRRCNVDFLSQGSLNDSKMRPPLYNTTYHTQQLLKWCTLLDDMDFEREGVPGVAPGMPVNAPTFERTTRFSWAWVMRQTRAYTKQSVETQCVIYKGRTLVPNSGETIYNGTIDGTTNTITLTYDPATQDKPKVKPGTWLLDIGMTPTPRGYFYRAVGVTEITDGTLTIEVQTRPVTGVVNATTRIAVMDNVVEVTNPYP